MTARTLKRRVSQESYCECWSLTRRPSHHYRSCKWCSQEEIGIFRISPMPAIIIKSCRILCKKIKSRLHSSACNQTQAEALQVMRGVRGTYFYSILILLAILSLNIHSTNARNATGAPKLEIHPWAIYLHKLHLLLPTERQGEGRNESKNSLKTNMSLFKYAVNTTEEDDIFMKSQGINVTQTAPELELKDWLKLQFNCQGSNCPKAEALQQNSGSGEHTYVPKILPEWKDLPLKRVVRSSHEDPENSTVANSANSKLGPLRIFKYVHHPDELMEQSESRYNTSDEMIRNEWENHQSREKYYSANFAERNHQENHGEEHVNSREDNVNHGEDHRNRREDIVNHGEDHGNYQMDHTNHGDDNGNHQQAHVNHRENQGEHRENNKNHRENHENHRENHENHRVDRANNQQSHANPRDEPASRGDQYVNRVEDKNGVQQDNRHNMEENFGAESEKLRTTKEQPKRPKEKQAGDSTESKSTTTSTERSLIPNSYFKKNSEEKKLGENGTEAIILNGTLDAEFRTRRSPFRPHWRDHRLYTQREALYEIQSPVQMHPAPPGLTAIAYPMQPNSFNLQSNGAMQQNSYTIQSSPMITQMSNPNQHVSLIPLAVPAVPVALPYANTVQNSFQNANQMASDRTFSAITGSDPQSPLEQSTFRFSKFQHPFSKKRPPHDKHGRSRRPSQPRPIRGRPGSGPVPSVMPPPKPIPLPRPRPQQLQHAPSSHGARPHGHGNVRRPPPQHSRNKFPPIPVSGPPPSQSVPYSYPKHAANIQDILTFFKTEENENEIHETDVKPSMGTQTVPALNSGIGFSSEFRDVQTSLLKDIKDFAKRPLNLKEMSEEQGGSGPIPVPSPRPSVLPLIDPEDPLDEIFSPKPKPVREMAKFRNPSTSTEFSLNAFPTSISEFRKGSENFGKSNGQDYSSNNNFGKSSGQDYSSNNNFGKSSGQDYNSNNKGGEYNMRDHNGGNSGKNRGRFEADDHRHSYYDDDRDDRQSQRNRHEPSSHASMRDERDKNSPRRPEPEESKEEEEDNYRSSHRDRPVYKSTYTQHHDRYKPHQDTNKNYQDFHKTHGRYNSDERPYSDNPNRPSSNTYTRDRDEGRDRDYDHHSQHYAKSQAKARRPSKSHRQRPHRRSRPKNHKFSSSNLSDRYRSRHRGREPGSRERPLRQSSEFVQSPTNKVKATMEHIYYQQRNKPIVIKRPYQPYRPIDAKKVEEKRKQQDQYWNNVGTVSTLDTKVTPAYRPATIQKHYHYYGVNSPVASPPGSTTAFDPIRTNSYQTIRTNSYEPTRTNAFVPSRPNYDSSRFERPASSSTRRPGQVLEGNISPEEDILEIHTGAGLSEVSTTPVYPIGGHPSGYSNGGQQSIYSSGGSSHSLYPSGSQSGSSSGYNDKGAKLQKMYMEYLQRKLEAQAEAQTESMLPITSTMMTTPKPKRPMRMKIHIYPNEKIHVVDQNNNQNVYSINNQNTQSSPQYNTHNLQYSTHHISHPPITQNTHSLFGHSPSHVYNPGASETNVHRSYGHYQTPSVIHPPTQPIISSQPVNVHVTPHGRPPAQSSVDKNKNLVLHLHVHRRNDDPGDGQMDMAGSDTVTSTVKPLTYEDIYQASNSDNVPMVENSSGGNNNGELDQADPSNDAQNKADEDRQNLGDEDKSLSMELPIQQDKIDDVLNTLLKLRD